MRPTAFNALSVILLWCVTGYAGSGGAIPDQSPRLIPRPAAMTVGTGAFVLTPSTAIVAFHANEEQSRLARYLTRYLAAATGYPLTVRDAAEMPDHNFIFLNYARDEELDTEGYTVEVRKDRVYLEANSDAGLFYAIQTFLQLMPPEVFGARPAGKKSWRIPCVQVRDLPRFSWRGMHLDVSRHFHPKEFIKTYIDMLAMHKMNVFHWHLTDDQGWRLEMKKFPKLTEVAAWRVDRENQPWNARDPQREEEPATYGGFYTQEEVRDIVKYAAERYITIVPEIEMPAHTTALLAAYPRYSCTGGPFRVPPGGVWPITDIFCAGNDSTFSFLEDVLTEVMDLFPGKYIHVGGDEADKKEWRSCPKCQARIRQEGLKDEDELQSYFIKRIEKVIVSRGRRLIGWDEILEGGLAPEATVMSWRGTAGGIAAARQGHDAVMTPGSHCYFDYYQGRPEYEPLAIGGYTPLSKVYSYEPVPDSLTPAEAKHILGAQGNVWTEYIPNPHHVQYMALPRMAALAEVVWSSRESRNWDSFAQRVEHQMKRYEAAGWSYARSAYLVSFAVVGDSIRKGVSLSLSAEIPSREIRYTLTGKDPTPSSPVYTHALSMQKTATVKAGAFGNGRLIGGISEQRIFIHKAIFRSVRLKYPYERYDGGGEGALTNGLRGSTFFKAGAWQGFRGSDFEATVDLGQQTRVHQLTTTFLEDTASWIFAPDSVEYSTSVDGVEFVSLGTFSLSGAQHGPEPYIAECSRKLDHPKARFIRVRAKSVGVVPEWHRARGEKAWLFVDEIIVE